MSYYVHHPQQQQQAYAPQGYHPHHSHPQQQQQPYGPPQGQYAHPQAQHMNHHSGQYVQQQPPAQYMPQGPPPPQSYPPLGGPRLLHIYTSGYSHKHAQIMDSDKQTVLYTIDSSSWSKPHTKVFAGNSGNLIGAISFHNLSKKIDLQVHGTSIVLESSGIFSSGLEYNSPAFGGGRLKWKNSGHFSSDIVCEQQGNQQTVAKFLVSDWAIKKEGKLELGPMVAGGGPAMDEIVVAGLAIAEQQRKARAASSSGGGGGA